METLDVFESDFVHLRSTLKILAADIETDADIEELRILNNGCKLRYCLPHGKAVLRDLLELAKTGQNVLYFVGFMGTRFPEVDESTSETVWRVDKQLINEISQYSGILAYLSGETSPGGDWGNLVVCRSPEVADQWNQGKTHDVAVCDLSPKYYTQIRIHRGELPKGLLSERFGVQRTLFMNFNNASATVTTRYIKAWSSTSCPENCICYPL